MKKSMLAALLCIIALTGCGADTAPANTPEAKEPTNAATSANATASALPSAPAADAIEIKEKLFLAQTNEIYINKDDYLGKTIKYEGIFDIFEIPEMNMKYYSVIRYGPGCCGDDGNVGFEVKWDGEYPKQNDWVEASGVLEEYNEGQYTYLRLALTSLNVLSERGAETVIQ